MHGITAAPESFYWTQAGSRLARDKPAEFNQALMELGALVCLPPHLAGDGRFIWFPRKEVSRLLTSSLFRKAMA